MRPSSSLGGKQYIFLLNFSDTPSGPSFPRTGLLDPVEITSQKRREGLWKLEGVTAGNPTPSSSSPGKESAVNLSKSSHIE